MGSHVIADELALLRGGTVARRRLVKWNTTACG